MYLAPIALILVIVLGIIFDHRTELADKLADLFRLNDGPDE